MSNIYKNVIELIGKTPLVEVENVEKRFKLQARLLVKLDGYNPAGSAKDRIAYQMIVDAEETGKLIANKILQNAGSAISAQANISRQSVLNLLG